MPSLFLSVAAKKPAEAFRDLMTRWKTPVFPCKPGKRAKVFQHVAETTRFPSTTARASCSSVQGFAPPLAGRERCPLPRGVWVQRAVSVGNALQSVTPVSHQAVWRHRNDAKFGPGTFFYSCERRGPKDLSQFVPRSKSVSSSRMQSTWAEGPSTGSLVNTALTFPVKNVPEQR